MHTPIDPDLADAFTTMFSYLARVKVAVDHDAAFRAALEANPLLAPTPPRQLIDEIAALVGGDRLLALRTPWRINAVCGPDHVAAAPRESILTRVAR